jgi:hypothetical protein
LLGIEEPNGHVFDTAQNRIVSGLPPPHRLPLKPQNALRLRSGVRRRA